MSPLIQDGQLVEFGGQPDFGDIFCHIAHEKFFSQKIQWITSRQENSASHNMVKPKVRLSKGIVVAIHQLWETANSENC